MMNQAGANGGGTNFVSIEFKKPMGEWFIEELNIGGIKIPTGIMYNRAEDDMIHGLYCNDDVAGYPEMQALVDKIEKFRRDFAEPQEPPAEPQSSQETTESSQETTESSQETTESSQESDGPDGEGGRIFMLYGSGAGENEYLRVNGGRIQNPEPCVLYLDSGPFEERAVNMLRAAGYQPFTFDGSPYAENYRHAGELGQVTDVALLPAEYQVENEEPNDDVTPVYRIHFETD
eukprot:SAG22_NODE_3312_length_1786_cov_2.332543_1_plen_233_part_00